MLCRILQPTMTPRKVHYWLDTGLIGTPITWGAPGHPTMLTFQQLLRVATVQKLRDDLGIWLPRVRESFSWILEHMFAESWSDLEFTRSTTGGVAIRSGREQIAIPEAQLLLPDVLTELTRFARATREAWDTRALTIPSRPTLVTDVAVMGGSPVVSGTRIETALIGSFVESDHASSETVREVRATYPSLKPAAIRDALAFEGFPLAA
ncbi:MAG: DUF433 domain-containing protein [Actinomycetota bacterium]